MSRRPDTLRFGLRIATLVWAAITLVHFTIWALASIIGGGLGYPWWLWFAVPPGAVIGAAWWWLDYRAS